METIFVTEIMKFGPLAVILAWAIWCLIRELGKRRNNGNSNSNSNGNYRNNNNLLEAIEGAIKNSNENHLAHIKDVLDIGFDKMCDGDNRIIKAINDTGQQQIALLGEIKGRLVK